MSRQVVLRLTKITKRFGSLIANDAIDLELFEGEVLALLGENGAGKTTLMNILFGHYVADKGQVEVFGHKLKPGLPGEAIKAGVGMVHQQFTLAENLTVLDNIIVGTETLWSWHQDTNKARTRLLKLADDFGLAIDPDAKVADLSVGERQRVEILKALFRQARILILDEPTAVLTPQETESLLATLRRLVDRGLSVILISHKMHEIMAASDRVVVLRQGQVVGDRITAQTNIHDLAEAMVGRSVPQPIRQPIAPGEPVMEMVGVHVGTGRERALLCDIDLTIRSKEIVGIAGVSGNGQAFLADLVSGLKRPQSGKMKIYGREANRLNPSEAVAVGIGRIPEDRHAIGLIGDMTIEENLVCESYRQAKFSRRGLLKFKAIRAYAEDMITAFDVRCPGPGAQVRGLSGGNLQKLILARAINSKPGLILANQPTRGLDIGAITYIHQRLLGAREQGAGVLFISEDLDEILELADRIAVIYRGRLTQAFPVEELTKQQIGLMMSGQELSALPGQGINK